MVRKPQARAAKGESLLLKRSFGRLLLEAFGCHVNYMARAIYIFLSLILAVTTGCGESSKSLEKFLGPAVGETILPSYNLDFDPSIWDFGEVLRFRARIFLLANTASS